MKELERILDLWSTAQKAGEPAVLATVVKTRGSSYRLPGDWAPLEFLQLRRVRLALDRPLRYRAPWARAEKLVWRILYLRRRAIARFAWQALGCLDKGADETTARVTLQDLGYNYVTSGQLPSTGRLAQGRDRSAR